MVVIYGLFFKDELDIFINVLLFICVIFIIVLIFIYIVIEIWFFSVSIYSVGIIFVCFRVCIFIDVCNWG